MSWAEPLYCSSARSPYCSSSAAAMSPSCSWPGPRPASTSSRSAPQSAPRGPASSASFSPKSLLLSLTGAALGLLLAYKTVSVIVANLPEFSFPHEAAIQINVPVLVFCIAVAIGTGILFGLAPAWQLSRPEVSQVMQSNTRKTTGSVRGRRIHNVLIAGQIALTLVMLAGAGAAIEGFLRVAHTRLGYDPHNIMSVGIPIHEGTYKTWPERAAYFEQMHDKAAQIPGATMVAISSNATPPPTASTPSSKSSANPAAQDQTFRANLVSREYFPALRIPLAARPHLGSR